MGEDYTPKNNISNFIYFEKLNKRKTWGGGVAILWIHLLFSTSQLECMKKPFRNRLFERILQEIINENIKQVSKEKWKFYES